VEEIGLKRLEGRSGADRGTSDSYTGIRNTIDAFWVMEKSGIVALLSDYQ